MMHWLEADSYFESKRSDHVTKWTTYYTPYENRRAIQDSITSCIVEYSITALAQWITVMCLKSLSLVGHIRTNFILYFENFNRRNLSLRLAMSLQFFQQANFDLLTTVKRFATESTSAATVAVSLFIMHLSTDGYTWLRHGISRIRSVALATDSDPRRWTPAPPLRIKQSGNKGQTRYAELNERKWRSLEGVERRGTFFSQSNERLKLLRKIRFSQQFQSFCSLCSHKEQKQKVHAITMIPIDCFSTSKTRPYTTAFIAQLRTDYRLLNPGNAR